MRQRGSETNLGQNARFCRLLPHRLTASLCNCLERTMIPGELFPASGEIEINGGRPTITLTVANTGDRPIQVGSHYHFYETNTALAFDRDQARGFRLDIPAGSATRFEPGQSREVTLVAYVGERRAVGFNGKVNGRI